MSANKIEDYYSPRTILIILSILLCILIDKICGNALFLSVYWCLLLLSNGVIRRLSDKNLFLYTVRIIMYFLPYGFSIMWVDDKYINGTLNVIEILSAILVGLSFHCFKTKQWKIMFSKYNIAKSPYYRKSVIFLKGLSVIGSAICEEVFFRGFLFSQYGENIPLLYCLSCLLFTLNHFLVPWGDLFKISDVLKLVFFSMIANCIFNICNSLLVVIIFHVAYDFFNIWIYFTIFDRYYIRKQYYDALEQEEEIEIEI